MSHVNDCRRSAARLATVLGLAGLTALSGCAWLGDMERRVALRPTPGMPADFAGLRWGDQRFLVPAAPQTDTPGARPQWVAMWWLPHADPKAPTLLYLHGTFRNLYQNLPKIEALRQAGFSVVAVDYRGWGDSTPIVPSEATIVADAHLAWAELQRRQPDPRLRVIYGHSMGGAVAVNVASSLRHGSDYGALVLESTFSRIGDVAAAFGAIGQVGAWITSLKFDSASRIGRIDAPLLMLHGDADRTVPIAVGRRLKAAAPAGLRWVEFPGGTHSRLQEDAPELYQTTFRDLIQRITPAAP